MHYRSILLSAGLLFTPVPATAAVFDFVGEGAVFVGGGGVGIVAAGGSTTSFFSTTHYVLGPVLANGGLASADSYSFDQFITYNAAGLTETALLDIILNNTLIGSFSVAPGTGSVTISRSGTFAPVSTANGVQIGFKMANNLSTGAGSIRFNDTGSTFTLTSSAGAVPEPATWAMMMIGFGMVGFAARRRRHLPMTVRFV